jgi:release factor glutamine methyltransferase
MNHVDQTLPALVSNVLRAAAQRLAPGETARLDAQLLLAHALGRSRSWLLAHAEAALAADVEREFAALLARRAAGEPLAYIVGYREFWSLTLQVTPAVLVPRPETELLVERALALLPPAPAAVADLGTGSGAIALALAVERPLWRLTATDKSAAALAVAAGNARALALSNVRFVAGDWLQPLQGERYALIASNPPYIGAGEPALRDPALQHEPQVALCSGPGGLDALAIIIAAAPGCLQPQGWLLLEHGAAQGPAVASMLVAQGYAHVRCHTDLAGQPRVTEAQKE